MVASTLTVDPLEDIAAEFGDTPGFFQLYTPTDRDLAASLVQRAEAAGYKGIVVTLDTWVPGWRPARSVDLELSAAARPLPCELLQRPGVPGEPAAAPRRRTRRARCCAGCRSSATR